MTVGIVSAMDEELVLYRDTCAFHDAVQRAGRTVHEARYEGHDLLLVKTGIGKVNAAQTAQLLIDQYEVEALLCTGSAGALHDGLDIGDVVLGEECLQHDLRVEFLGLPPGQVPFTDLRIFASAPRLLRKAEAVRLPNHALRRGRILTGDTFLQDEAARTALHEELGGDCVEMEGAAIGQVCTLNNVPFLVVRAISDRADGSSDVDFQDFLHQASRSSARIVLHVLEALSGEEEEGG